MSNKERGNGKTKKIVVGVATVVAVAAIAVPTALTLAGGKDDAGASNQNNKYNIIVSSGIENVPDYSISIEKGTSVSTLKTMLKAIDGYTITGVYKDEALSQEYGEDEIITSDAKIYIGFEAITYTVTICDEQGNAIQTLTDVAHKSDLGLADPEKQSDNFATYIFTGWVNDRGEQVNIHQITSDMTILPTFKTIMKEYKIGYVGGDTFKNSISITVGGELVTLDSTYHYGSTIKIRATAKLGNEITEFKVTVNGITIDVLTYANRVEENGTVYYEYEIAECNGDLIISYSETVQEFSLGTIPEEVEVVRNGHILTSNDKIYYGDELEITYTLWEDCTLNSFEVTGAEFKHGTENTYKVIGNTEIKFDYTYAYAYLIFKQIEGGYEISGIRFGNNIDNVVVPETYKGKEVISIGAGAFRNEENILSIKLPESITNIGLEAFSYCSNLKNIEIPNGVENIFSEAFEFCRSLTEIVIPESVKSIGNSAFFACAKLSSITLPEGLTTLNYHVFGNCGALTSITIPNSITDLEEEAFSGCSSLKEVVLSSNLKSIGRNAFNNCVDLSSIVLPEGLISLGEGAFHYCLSLTSINIPSSITTLSSGLFSSCSGLSSIIIPSSVKEINEGAFDYCSNLKTVVIESAEVYNAAIGVDYDSAGSILANATEVRVLASIDDGSNEFLSGYEVTTDGEYNVYDLTQEAPDYSYLTFTECEGGYEVTAFDKSSGVTDVVIPATYKGQPVIGIKSGSSSMGVFYNSNITSVKIRNGVTNIGKGAFNACKGLTSVTIPNSITSISDYAFFGCKNLTAIEIPESVTSIGNSAFSRCDKLYSIKVEDGNNKYTSKNILGKEVSALIDKETKTLIVGCSTTEIPSDGSVISIYMSAFYMCSDLISVTIPDSITSIGNAAFSGCNNLTSVTIGEKVTSIGMNAFNNCSSLSSITIPSSVIDLGSNAFDCSNLKLVTIESISVYNTMTGNTSICAGGILRNATEVRVPKEIVNNNTNSYLMGRDFAAYTDGDYYVFVPVREFSYLTFSDVDGGCEVSAFDGSVTEVIIPSMYAGKKVLGIKASSRGPSESVFLNSNITSVKLSEGVEYIGDCAFYNCLQLKNVTLGTIKTIGSSVFVGCSGLSSITLPHTVESLSTSVFNGCTNLTSITIPSSVKSMGIYCFVSCTNLKTIVIESEAFYSTLNSSYFSIFSGSTTEVTEIRVLKTIDDGSNAYLNDNYTKTSGAGYWIYTRNQ